MHPNPKHWVLIDHFSALTRLHGRLLTRVMHSAEYHSNHCLVSCKLRLHFKPKPEKGGPLMKTFKLSNIRSAEVEAKFQAGVQSKLENVCLPEDPSH